MVDRVNIIASSYENWVASNFQRLIDISSDSDIVLENEGFGMFITIPIMQYPEFIRLSLAEISKGYTDYSGITFGSHVGNKNLDDEFTLVPADCVLLTTYSGQSLIRKKNFYKMLLQFAENSISAAREFQLEQKAIVNEDWLQRIALTIPEIGLKIDVYS
jgi:hypothetical protein